MPWEPVVTRPGPMTEEEQQALLDAVTDQDAPWWLEEADPDPQDDPPPEEYDLAEVAAECRQISEDQARAAASAARMGTTGALAAIAALGPARPGPARFELDQFALYAPVPHAGLSVAMRIRSLRIAAAVGGRPGGRRLV